MKIVFCTPTYIKPHPAYLEAMEKCLPAVEAAGFEHQCVFDVGCPYISSARARMLGKALATDAQAFVFLDDDVSWCPQDMVSLLKAPGEVVAGTYRYKLDEVKYMSLLVTDHYGYPMRIRGDGAILADRVPAGFLKVTRSAVEKFANAYPELVTDKDKPPSVDLFNHGAHEGLWWGEDYAFCRRWRALGEDVWLLPDMNIDHHHRDGRVFAGNFHEFMLRQPKHMEAA